ncbi:MAG: aminoacyl-tRNA deacylase [Desulfuromonas sp.]|nr:MAG: aminoacyl-tRNA deacylase [Desulfuromonas sp.]
MADFIEIKDFLSAQGLTLLEFDAPIPSAETAAAAVDCTIAEIAKSILLLVGDAPVLVVTSGDMKVNSSLLKKATGLSGKVRLPAADEVKRHTGFTPGGVSPFLLPSGLPVLLDYSLGRFYQVYPACGNSHSAVAITFAQLKSLTGGVEVRVSLPLA